MDYQRLMLDQFDRVGEGIRKGDNAFHASRTDNIEFVVVVSGSPDEALGTRLGVYGGRNRQLSRV